MPRMMSKPLWSMVMGWNAPTQVGLPLSSSGPFRISVTVSRGWTGYTTLLNTNEMLSSVVHGKVQIGVEAPDTFASFAPGTRP